VVKSREFHQRIYRKSDWVKKLKMLSDGTSIKHGVTPTREDKTAGRNMECMYLY